jgi:hypothetical protein
MAQSTGKQKDSQQVTPDPAAPTAGAGGISLAAPNRTGLPDKLKTGVESLSGLSLDDVRVHYNSPKPAQLQALAYTQGSDIHVAPGQERHLPHEAWHVVQQKQGRVWETAQSKGIALNDDSNLEKEADRMGMKSLQTRNLASNHINTKIEGGSKTIQRKVGFEFEVPNWRITNPAHLGKNTRLINGNGWYLQNDVLGGNDYDPEFVTRPVEETDAGWRQLDAAMQDMNNTLQAMDNIADPPGTETVQNLGGIHATAIVDRHNRGPLIGDPQVSTGINLSRLPMFLSDLGHDPMGVAPQSMQSDQLAHEGGAATQLAGCAQRAAQRCNPITGRVRSEEYEGLIALMGSFVRRAASIFATYMKQAAHVMSRSNLPSAMAKTPEANWRGRVNATTLLNDVLFVADLASTPLGNQPELFPYGVQGATQQERQQEPWRFVDRNAWIRGIANGRDLLRGMLGSSSWGGMGLERVGPQQTNWRGADIRPQGIILELRDVQTSVPWDHWYPFTTAVFRYIREVNDLTVMNPQYHGFANFGTQGTPGPVPQAPPLAPPANRCFITTACVQAKGLPDDCLELTTLRTFRDEYIATRENGMKMIVVYYQNSPAIVAAIEQHPDAQEIYNRLFKIISMCVRYIQDGERERALQIYIDMVIGLRNRFTPMSKIPAFFYEEFGPCMRLTAIQRVPKTDGQAIAGKEIKVVAPPAYTIDFLDNGPSSVQAGSGLNGGSTLQRMASPAQAESAPATISPNRTGLPDKLKSGVETLSGLSLDDVRVPCNPLQPAPLRARGSKVHTAQEGS